MSLGVLHHNEVIHIENYGYRGVEKKIAPDQDTLYFIASLTKAFIAAGIGILVDEKKIEVGYVRLSGPPSIRPSRCNNH